MSVVAGVVPVVTAGGVGRERSAMVDVAEMETFLGKQWRHMETEGGACCQLPQEQQCDHDNSNGAHMNPSIKFRLPLHLSFFQGMQILTQANSSKEFKHVL